jgi:prolyl oligopeptidase
MRTFKLFFIVAGAAAVALSPVDARQATPPPDGAARQQKLTYPQPPRGDVVDDYFGTKVPDPYRWMEDLDAKAVADWVASENALTERYLQAIPLRDQLRKRITELWNYPKVATPFIEGGHLFYRRNSGLQKQSLLFMRPDLKGSARVIVDPNEMFPSGDISLAQTSPSPDASLLAYTTAEGGADWQTIHVRNIATLRDLPDVVKWMRFSGLSWTKDAKGFFYSRYPEPPQGKALQAALSGQALYYHRLGTPQSEDRLIYERKDLPTWFINGSVTDDGRYLFVFMAQGSENKNRLYVKDLGDARAPAIDAPVTPVADTDDAEYAPIGNRGATIFLRTDLDAPNRKIIAIDLANRDRSAWKTIVPERPQAIESAIVAGTRIAAEYLVDVQSKLELFTFDGSPAGAVTLPGPGSLAGLSGREDSNLLFYTFTSPIYPATVFAYDLKSGRSTPFEPPTLPIDVTQFETRQMFAISKDGTKVPFFLTARKNIQRDGRRPTMIYGYGGFSISTTPTYRADVPAWLELGGIWVTANMRGGAEYGEAWHRAGMLDKKQNVFDDFIAVAEYLVNEHYTSPATLGIMGGSNGGLLVGAVMEQRPDLYAVALPAVGVMDMLRYDKFTGGRAWVTEYGSSSSEQQFPVLFRYSPLHNVKSGTCYPATLVTTADHDDRVVPSHSFKFIATLQQAQGCDKPVLIRVETQASHGYRPTDKRIAELADEWAFAAANMGIESRGAATRSGEPR